MILRLPDSFFEPEPSFEEALALVRPVPIRTFPEIFDSLAACVVEQQHPLRSSKKLHARLLDGLGLDVLKASRFDDYTERALSSLKLSEAKIRSLEALSVLASQHPDLESIRLRSDFERLLGAVPGIGAWTLDMIELFDLGAADVFPSGDYHLGRAFLKLPDLAPCPKTPAQIRVFASRWSPHRSLAARLLWAGLG